MFYSILLGFILFTSTAMNEPPSPTKEAVIRLDCKKDFRKWAANDFCPRKKYSIEDMRLVDMNGDQLIDVFIITKQADHLCMLCATSMSQVMFVCPYCEKTSLGRTITEKKHEAFHDTVQTGEPGLYSYSMYLFFQQKGGTFKHCNCDPIYLGTEYYAQSILINEDLRTVSHFFDYPNNTRDKYVYKWNRKTKQLENF